MLFKLNVIWYLDTTRFKKLQIMDGNKLKEELIEICEGQNTPNEAIFNLDKLYSLISDVSEDFHYWAHNNGETTVSGMFYFKSMGFVKLISIQEAFNYFINNIYEAHPKI